MYLNDFEEKIISNFCKNLNELSDESLLLKWNSGSVVAMFDTCFEDMFTGYYEFDSHDQACWFNSEQEKADRDIMLDLISQLISRLRELNDGSFVIEDLETERLKNL